MSVLLCVGIRCSNMMMTKQVTYFLAALCRNGDIRLRGNSSQYEGRVEVCIDEEWGSVCGERWDQWDAAVVCRQLGYSTQGKRLFMVAPLTHKMTDAHMHRCLGNGWDLIHRRADCPMVQYHLFWQ